MSVCLSGCLLICLSTNSICFFHSLGSLALPVFLSFFFRRCLFFFFFFFCFVLCCRALAIDCRALGPRRVTETDRSNEALIQRGLQEAFPEDRFLGEVRLFLFYVPGVIVLVSIFLLP